MMGVSTCRREIAAARLNVPSTPQGCRDLVLSLLCCRAFSPACPIRPVSDPSQHSNIDCPACAFTSAPTETPNHTEWLCGHVQRLRCLGTRGLRKWQVEWHRSLLLFVLCNLSRSGCMCQADLVQGALGHAAAQMFDLRLDQT